MSRIVICRHGHTSMNESPTSPECIRGWLDLPLDAQGCEEATQLARRIDRLYKVKSIVTSDLARCAQTAEILADHLGASIIPEPRLRTWNLLGYQGRPVAEVLDELRDLEQNPERRPLAGGESFVEFAGRVQACLLDILHEAKKSKYDRVVLSHGRVISVVPRLLRGDMSAEPYGQYSKTGALLEIKPSGHGYKMYDLG